MFMAALFITLVIGIIVAAQELRLPMYHLYPFVVVLYTGATATQFIWLGPGIISIVLFIPGFFAISRLVRAVRSKSSMVPAAYRSSFSVPYFFGFSLAIVGSLASILTFCYLLYAVKQKFEGVGVGIAIMQFLALLTQFVGISTVEVGIWRWMIKARPS